MDYSPRGCKELDTNERLILSQFLDVASMKGEAGAWD